MVIVNIAKDFTKIPGARYYTDGPFSGQEFFDKILKEAYKSATLESTKLKVILDGTEGYASSFINEAFRLLGKEYGPDNVWNNIIIISDEIPAYIFKVKEAVYEKFNT